MKPAQSQRLLMRRTTRVVFAIMFAALSSATARPQEQHTPDIAPPPAKIISSQERGQINGAKDPKARVKTSLLLAEAHLVNAETHTAQQSYDTASSEAGRYWAIVEDAFAYLTAMKQDSNKTRDLYKRLELSLRSHGPRLSAIRRTTPAEYSIWIKQIEESARNGRTEALNAFYGQTVIPDAPRGAGELKASEKGSPESMARPRLKP